MFFAFYSYNDKRNSLLLNVDSAVSSQLNNANATNTNQNVACTGPVTNDNQEQIIVFNILREMFNNDSHINQNRNDLDLEISYDSVIVDNNNISQSLDDLPTYENAIKKQTNK